VIERRWPDLLIVLSLPVATFAFVWAAIGTTTEPSTTEPSTTEPSATASTIYVVAAIGRGPSLSALGELTIGIAGLCAFAGLLAWFAVRVRRHPQLCEWWPAVIAAPFVGLVSAWSVRSVPTLIASTSSQGAVALATVPVVLGLLAWVLSNRGNTRRWQHQFRQQPRLRIRQVTVD
jgi:hypothetical protein